MGIELKSGQYFDVSVGVVKDRNGNVTTLDGAPQWFTDNAQLVALAPAADGMSCRVSTIGPIGSVTVQCIGDAKEGEEVLPVIGRLAIDVVPGLATVIELTAGPAADLP